MPISDSRTNAIAVSIIVITIRISARTAGTMKFFDRRSGL